MESFDREIKSRLKERFGKTIRFDEPMSRHTYFRVGGPAEVFATPETIDDLVDMIRWCREEKVPLLVIGGGSNLLVTDGGIAGMVIALSGYLKRIETAVETERYVVIAAMAGAKLQALCRFAVENGFEGLNFALGIPGTVGGAVIMNAGTAAGSMADVIESVNIILPENGKMQRIDKDRLYFSYRTLSWSPTVPDADRQPPIILEARCRLKRTDPLKLADEARAILERRRNSQPTNAPSAGCFFKNPTGGRTAGELIDKAGLKGVSVGGATVSSKHANFIINTGSASATDILALMQIVQDRVADTFHLELEPEVKIVGR